MEMPLYTTPLPFFPPIQSLQNWRKMIGMGDGGKLELKYRDSGKDVSGPKIGKIDEKGEAHVGGNTWAGGSGGRDTAGPGGKGGPFRLDSGQQKGVTSL